MRRDLQAGALELEGSELGFETAADGRVELRQHGAVASMAVVAEMMIWANSAVAERICLAFPGASLLRRHPAPRLDAFQEIAKLCEKGGAPLDVSSGAALASSLEAAARASSDAAATTLVNSLATRAMAEAEYFSTGDAAVERGGRSHFGLGLEFYTHFTSPIRRYADIVVHRQLLAALAESGRSPVPPDQLVISAGVMNQRNRDSKRAQRECTDLFFLLSLRSNPRVEIALVYTVKPTGVLLFISKYKLRAAVHLLDRRGNPINLPSDGCESQQQPSSYIRAESGDGWLRFWDKERGKEVFSIAMLQKVWVQLSVATSRAHGPFLKVSLLKSSHPDVTAATARKAPEPLDDHEAGGKLTQLFDKRSAEEKEVDMKMARIHELLGSSASSHEQAAGESSVRQSGLDSSLAAVADAVLAASEDKEIGSLGRPNSMVTRIDAEEIDFGNPRSLEWSSELIAAQQLVSRLSVEASRRNSGMLDHNMQRILEDSRTKLQALYRKIGVN